LSGKAIIILVLGFSSIFIFFGRDLLNVSTKSNNDMVENIEESKILGIARSATETVISYYWQNPDSAKSLQAHQVFFDNVKLNGGNIVSNIDRDPTDPNMYRITTTASSGDSNNFISKTITVLYGPKRLTEMASYSEHSGNVWWTGDDVVNGDIYCGGWIKVYNHPTFNSNVYSRGANFDYFRDGSSWNERQTNHSPIVDPNNVFFNTELRRSDGTMNDLKDKAISGGKYFNGSRATAWQPSKDTMFVEIKDKNIEIKFTENALPTSHNIEAWIPNGVLYADNYVVRLKGRLDGQLLISCNGNINLGKGKILLDDNIEYKDDPRNSVSDDMLGLVANGNVEVADTPPNQADIDIHASIYSVWSGLTAENGQTKADAGNINFFGSLVEYQRKAVGKFDPATGVVWGYGRSYDYDTRLKISSPPSFPKLQGFNVLAWYEGDSPK